MELSQLLEVLEEVFESQRYSMRIVTGVYLSHELLEMMKPILTPDDPEVGAAGRYERVPIFPESSLGAVNTADVMQIETHRGIRYSYVQMDAVD